MRLLEVAKRAAMLAAIVATACMSTGCTTTVLVMYAYDKITEGDPTACYKLNTVERALTARCGPHEPGSLLTKDVAASGLPHCPLSLAARDPQFWPVLPELLAKGAQPESCEQPPLVALAQAQPCPAFAAASPQALQSLRWLAEADGRAIHHDVVRMLSCPAAQATGLSGVLDGWLALGLLPTSGLPFSPLGAMHPSYIDSSFARALEGQGHTARAALGAYQGQQPSGFDAALRSADRIALDWWLDRLPELANRVPATQGNQFAWIPLARVITPSYMPDAQQRRALVEYLLSRGADPWKPLPHDPRQSVVSFARQLDSPLLTMLDPPLGPARSGGPVRQVTARIAGAIAAAPAQGRAGTRLP